MPALQIRDLPDPVYRKLVDRARREHRSISQQATVLLAEALEASTIPKDRRRALLEELRERPLVSDIETLQPPEALVREDRER